MMNGTTLCPHCETRFKITGAQLTAHHGMVRCGHCLQAFDARPNFISDQPNPRLDLSIRDDIAKYAEETFVAAPVGQGEPQSAYSDQFASDHLPFRLEADDTPDLSLTSTNHFVSVDEQAELADAIHGDEKPYTEHQTLADQLVIAEDAIYGSLPASARRRTWPWAIGIFVLAVLLLAQSAYFLRVSLAAHLPALKPALIGFCQLLNCSVPLPQKLELISIESSGLTADPEHENQITLNALLRNHAGYTQAFPVLALALNDSQDKPLARRLFLSADYLPAEEREQAGLLGKHEVSIRLRMDTTDLRPAGYRLELFYPQ